MPDSRHIARSLRWLAVRTSAAFLIFGACVHASASPGVGGTFRHVWDLPGFATSCGAPTSRVTWTGLEATQDFARCSMHARIEVDAKGRMFASPIASLSPTVMPTPTPTPVPPLPTAPPPSPTPVPTPTPAASSPTAYALSLINQDRAQHGYPPYSLGTCPGALTHSQAMAASGSIWHSNPSYPAASFPNDLCGYSGAENVGYGYGSVDQALSSINTEMMSESWTPGCTGSHVCSILSPLYHEVSIGIVTTPAGVTYETQDFQ
jgi:uncharacterized protein YkwD